MGDAVLDDSCADRDSSVHVAGEVEIADRSRVHAATVRLKLGNDLHCAYLRCAGDGPGREAGSESIVAGVALLKFPRYVRHEMYDV